MTARTLEKGQQEPCPHCRHNVGKGIASGWHRRTGPGPPLRSRYGEDEGWLPWWADHRWRYRNTDGRWTYVAEPYDFGEECIEDLAWLVSNGFDVVVSAGRARHYPGHTVAIEITPEVGAS